MKERKRHPYKAQGENMIILIGLIIALVYVMYYNARRVKELENCYKEIDELNNEIKNLKLELEEAYEELASR